MNTRWTRLRNPVVPSIIPYRRLQMPSSSQTFEVRWRLSLVYPRLERLSCVWQRTRVVDHIVLLDMRRTRTAELKSVVTRARLRDSRMQVAFQQLGKCGRIGLCSLLAPFALTYHSSKNWWPSVNPRKPRMWNGDQSSLSYSTLMLMLSCVFLNMPSDPKCPEFVEYKLTK